MFPFVTLAPIDGLPPHPFWVGRFHSELQLSGHLNIAVCVYCPAAEPQFGPLVSRVRVHPSLGTVAVQLEPPYVVQASAGVAAQPLSGLSLEEQELARWAVSAAVSVPFCRFLSSRAPLCPLF